MTVAIERNKTIMNEVLYNSFLNIFGVFTDGAPVKLNMEIKVLHNKAASKIYLVFIASPLEKDKDIWQQLRTIQKDFSIQ